MPDAIKELIPLTDHQLVFDTVARHLLTQGEKAVAQDDFQCRYRGEGGKTCAVGCLIPDFLYDENVEGLGVHANLELQSILGYDEDSPEEALLKNLQSVHDGCPPTHWSESLAEVADRFRLDKSVLDEFTK